MESNKPKLRRQPSSKATGSGPVFEVRSAARLTQIEFAEILKVSEATIRNYETRGIFPLKAEAMQLFLRYVRENDLNYSTII